ncbi:MAG TPA: alpha-2-macroglobulin family protein, partial [Pyrinomonadaceae bacterium]
EAIHVYIVGDTYDQSSRLPLEFYVSTFYADGTPAPSNVVITKGSSDDDRSGTNPGQGGGRRVANIETNSFGLAKVSLPKPPLDEGDDRVYLRFSAKDAQGQTGHQNEDFSYEDKPAIRIHLDKTLYRQGEPIRVNLTSSEKNLEAVVDVVRNLQVLRSEVVHLSEGHASFALPDDGRFKDEISVMACAWNGAREQMCDSRNILYPRDKDLKLDVRPAQETYRPGEEARVQFNVLAPDGRAVESALGIAVFDRAVEERARTDQEFGSHYNFYGNYGDLLGWDESLAGVSRKDLEHLDLSKPLPKGLELLAEVMLNRSGHFSPNEFSGDDYDLEQQKVFADLIKKQFDTVRAALNARYLGRDVYPKDEGMLRRMLAEFDINLDTLSDPWGTPYRVVFYVNRENDMLKFVSAGADKRFDTDDDFSAAEFSWPYFKPIGEKIDRAIKEHHARTGGFIRDAATFQAEMLRQGVDFNSLRDRWNEPYRVVFDVDGVHYVLKIESSGPDKKSGSSKNQDDDFTLWSSMIDYFAERRAEIDAALSSNLKATNSFPQDTLGLSNALRKAKIDFDALRDPWGHKYYATFKTDSRFTDRVTVETRSNYGEKPQMRTDIKPVTQKVGIVSIRSAGADGVQGTVDDFDAGTFSLVLSEQDHSDVKPKPVETSAILTGNGGAITGMVLDPMGAVIPNANVRATLSSTQTFYEAVTNAEGKYTLINLPSGTYEVRVKASGFRDTVVTNLLVSSSNIVTLNLTLELGAAAETVTVTSESTQVETSVSATVASRQVRDLPSLPRSGLVNVITKSGTSDRQIETSTPRLREYFPETLLWQPSLETDAKGQASLRFKLADNITTWKMAVIGSTANGEIGMAEKEILAFQPFFVEHDPPRILTEGDEINLPVVLRNYLDKPQAVELEMKPESWFTLLGPAQRRAEVPAGDNSRQIFDFRVVASIKDGKQRVTAKGAGQASDQIERSVSVHPFGEEIARTTSGILGEQAVLDTEIPANVINKTARAELKIYPSLMAHVIESIEGIMQRPYGCAEQTISAAYPSLLALRAYKAMGKEHPAIEAKARRFVQQGYERLLNYRAPEGGFSYWGRGGADLALTAYALRFLHDAGEFIEVDEGVIKEGRDWLGKQQRTDGSWPAHIWWEKTEDKRRTALLTAYIARVLAETNDKESSAEANNDKTAKSLISSTLKRALHYLSERYTEVDEPYLIAAYALAALDAGDLKGAEAPIAKLRMLAHEEAGTNYWSLETNTPFYGWGLAGRIETTALALQAMTKYCEKVGCASSDKVSSNPRPPTPIPQLVDRGLLFLLKQQDRYGVWYSTQATVNTLDALVALLSKNGSIDAGGQAQVFVNGKFATNVEMPPGDALTSPLVVDLSQFISTGSNRIEIRRASPSAARASVQVVETYYVPWQTVVTRDAAHSSVEDSTRDLRLNVGYDKSTARVGEEVTCKVEAERVGFKGYGMLLAEIGLPPGADVDRATLEDAMKSSGWSLSQYDVLPDRVVVYLWPQAGGTKFEFKFRPRFGLAAESAPSLLYDYYNPEARTTIAPTKFSIK